MFSQVLADASEICDGGKKIVRLHDEKLEDSIVVNHFLGLAVDSALDIDYCDVDIESCRGILRLVRFMEKYECTRLWGPLHYFCTYLAHGGLIDYQIAFVIGSATNDEELCQVSLRKLCPQPDLHCSVSHNCYADPGSFSLELWELLDHDGGWALAVACRRSRTPSASEQDDSEPSAYGSYLEDVFLEETHKMRKGNRKQRLAGQVY